MPKKYGVNATFSEGQAHLFGEIGSESNASRYRSGIAIIPNPFQCCGTSTIRGFDGHQIYFPPDAVGTHTGFAEKAAFLAALWGQNQGHTHYVYVLNAAQKAANNIHRALVECGSVEVCKFPNLQPGHTNDLHMFVCNLNEGIGKFFDAGGVAFTEPAKANIETTIEPAKAPSRSRRTKTVVVHDVPLSTKTPEVV
jgi:hypothetical protein